MYAPQFSLRPAGPQKQVQVSHAAGKAAQPQTPESLVQVASQTHEGVDHRSMLGKLKVQFGVYKGKTFSWLLNNDRDYMVKVLASHEVEQECDKSTTLLQRYKDVLLRYARLFPEVTAAISAKRRAEMEAMGHRMVGFGTYSSLTYRELYESREQKIRSYRNLIRRLRVRNVNSQFSKLKQYILSMDMDCTPAPSTSCSLMCTTNADVQSNTTLRILSVSSLSPQCQDTNLGSATVPYASSTTPGPPSHPTAQMFPLESFRISLPPEQREWLSTVLFSTGATGKCVLSEQLQLWYNPPGP
ncbi:uncharacterized protein LOC106937936 [Poecilia latipinna]|uniref:uncharacterized protein LOC106937936 n=1 Tax=Poecilia latipinna TaxID=48699 RepID=UPI00072ECC81|nr:PREDICTED: uncharacterized protein LOC106937936 [Poecilia latipinna]